MYQFAKEWPDEIVAVSTLPEFQTACIEIRDPSLVTRDYNVKEAKWTYTGDSLIYPQEGETGQARIIAPRWGSDLGVEAGTNAFTETPIRVQLPYQAVERVRKGFKMVVVESTRNPALEGLMFVCTSDFQGSSAAARTLQFKLDGDSQVQPAPPGPEPEPEPDPEDEEPEEPEEPGDGD